jgi:hypothetical protein
MANPLVPSISSNQLSMSALLDNPTRLNQLIAKLAADQLVVDAFFRPAVTNVIGGAMLYDVLLSGGNFSVRDVEARAPGSEYIITTGDVTRDLATPQDWGARTEILDEERTRFDQVVIGNRLLQLANTISRKIDQIAIAAVEAALSKYSIASVPGHQWSNFTIEGASPTAPANRPSADLANAALLVRTDDTGVRPPDTLVCHPGQLANLRIGYGDRLDGALAAVGITNTRTSMQVATNVAYVVSAGVAGILGFEPATYGMTTPASGVVSGGSGGLVTEIIPDRERRATWIQSYALPCFAITIPGAIRKSQESRKCLYDRRITRCAHGPSPADRVCCEPRHGAHGLRHPRPALRGGRGRHRRTDGSRPGIPRLIRGVALILACLLTAKPPFPSLARRAGVGRRHGLPDL